MRYAEMVRSSRLLLAIDGSQIRQESKRTEAAICLHRALRVYRSMKNPGLIITRGEPIPAPVGEILVKMNALDIETQFEEKDAIFKEQILRGEALCQDGSFT